MRKLSFIFVCMLLAILLALTGCSFDPAGDSSQETEETQPGIPSDTPEENPDNTPSEDNPSTAPGSDDKPSEGEDNPDKPNSPTFTRDEQERILDMNFEATMLAVNEWVRSEGYADISTPPEASTTTHVITDSYKITGNTLDLTLSVTGYEYKDGADTLTIKNGKVGLVMIYDVQIPADVEDQLKWCFTNNESAIMSMRTSLVNEITYNEYSGLTTTGGYDLLKQEASDFTLNGKVIEGYDPPVTSHEEVPGYGTPTPLPEEIL